MLLHLPCLLILQLPLVNEEFFFLFTAIHAKVPRLEVELMLQLQVCATATATLNPSCICNLYHSLQQYWIFNPLTKARD